MNAVGIDISKGKSTIAIMRPLKEVVASPYEICHTDADLKKLASFLKSLSGETRVIMEYTGKYYQPVARYLHEAGIFVSVVNALLLHNYNGNNTLRRGKTDKIDAVMLARYALDRWLDLVEYTPEDVIRQMLKTFSRQYNHYMKIKVMLKNNIISQLDQTFPGLNTLFTSQARQGDGHEKWVDFAAKFWHCQCVCSMSANAFKERYRKWCKKAGYDFSSGKAAEIHAAARGQVATLPRNDATRLLITQAVTQINAIAESLSAVLGEMQRLSAMLPEFPVVMAMKGVGSILGPQLMAEIGDIRRFHSKKALVAFAGIDAPPFQSGLYEAKNRKISKRGSSPLRKTLFQVMRCILIHSSDDPVFCFIDKKRSEGKHYYVYMMAAANKFLRIYFARVKEYLDLLSTAA